MSYITSKHDSSLCKRCNAVGKNILNKIKVLVEELEEIMKEEAEGLGEDVRCILKKGDFPLPLITFPEDNTRVDYKISVENTTPVWEPKRYPSTELVGGDWLPCLCSKSNGLVHECLRRHCRGRAGCFTNPPTCPASRRWAKPLTQLQLDYILKVYGPDKLQPCEDHLVWDPNCFACRYYITKTDKMISSMSIPKLT